MPYLILIITLFYSGFISAEFEEKIMVIDDRYYKYQIHKKYLSSNKKPVILFLHGAGERGSDGVMQTKTGLGKFVRNGDFIEDAYIVFPQCPKGSWWSDELCERIAMQALASIETNVMVDKRRIYLTGVSMGAYGSWYLSAKYKNKFAAVVAIAGRLKPGEGRSVPQESILYGLNNAEASNVIADSIKDIPVWISHGTEDRIVPVGDSRMIYNALKDRGNPVVFNEINKGNHNVWDSEYANKKLINWLFSKIKGGPNYAQK